MKAVCIVLSTIFFSIACQSQSFSFPASGRADTTLVAADGVTLVSSINSTGCVPGGSSSFVFSTAHVSAGAIYRNSRWSAGCKGSTDVIKLDFSTVNTRPMGMNFSIYDVDNGADSVSVRMYSGGQLVPYAHFLYAPTYVTASGSSTATGFHGSGGNNSLLDDPTGRIDIAAIDVMIRIDSILFYKHNNSDASGNPSQSFGNFNWSNSTVLPIKLLSFSGRQQGLGFQFYWQVLQEEGTSTYQIQYSESFTNFLSAGNAVPAKGTAGGSANYAAAISSPSSAPVLYFRLAATDADGRTSYSNTMGIHRRGLLQSKVYRGHSGNGFIIQLYTETPLNGMVQLMTVDGRIILKKVVTISRGTNIIPISISSSMLKGIYLITGAFGQGRSFEHLIVKE